MELLQFPCCQNKISVDDAIKDTVLLFQKAGMKTTEEEIANQQKKIGINIKCSSCKIIYWLSPEGLLHFPALLLRNKIPNH